MRSGWTKEGEEQGRATKSRNEAVEKKRRDEKSRALLENTGGGSSSESRITRMTKMGWQELHRVFIETGVELEE